MSSINDEIDLEIFLKIKTHANGLLDPAIYRKIFMLSKSIDNNIIEIGTAHGAATIAAALGASDKTVVYSIDKILGGSRDDYGNVENNIKIINNNFKYFEVDKKISFHVGNSEDLLKKIPSDESVGMLILDADGAIDRDFNLYFNLLDDNAPIVIDDYRPEYIHAIRTNGRNLFIDQKYRITSYLVDYFEECGLIVREKIIKHTYFCRKAKGSYFNRDNNIDAILNIYRKLIFSFPREKSKTLHQISQYLFKYFPEYHYKIKSIVGRSAIDE